MARDGKVDIFENDIPEQLLGILLRDHTTGRNIFWACDDYEALGKGYAFGDTIELAAITGDNSNVIMPRVMKDKSLKKKRAKEKAEIFTPAWLCNEMCNATDEPLLAEGCCFNRPFEEDGRHDWEVSDEPLRFAEGKTWQDYICQNCLEITCGEAPFLVSRYDAVSGEPIPIGKRIGLLDRKIRVAGENTNGIDEWLRWVIQSFKSTYGYEWQGDNILLARKNMLFTFIEYHEARWGTTPGADLLVQVAEIVSWNIFQMDGLKMVIPNSCRNGVVEKKTQDIFGGEEVVYCEGCRKDIPLKHNGIATKIMDWENNRPIEFRSLYGRGKK